MRILEFHFNQVKTINNNRLPDKISRSFCFLPKNIYEKRVGGIFVIGEIVNLLPRNTRLLENLALTVKQSYYGSPLKSIDKSYENCLKSVNNFLSQELKNDNVGWLGNLNCAILAVKNSSFYYAKIGDIRTVLLRDKLITAIDIEKQKTATRQTKSFNDIIYGDLEDNDCLFAMTKGADTIFNYSEKATSSKKAKHESSSGKESLIETIAKSTDIDTKKLQEAFNQIEGLDPEICGSCLVFQISDTFKESEPQVFKIGKPQNWFSLKPIGLARKSRKEKLTFIYDFTKRKITVASCFLRKLITAIIDFVFLKLKQVFHLLTKQSLSLVFGLLSVYNNLLLAIKTKTNNFSADKLIKEKSGWVKRLEIRLIDLRDRNKISIPIDTLRTAKIKDIIHRVSIRLSKATIRKRRIVQLKANRYLLISLFAILFLGFILFRIIGVIDNDSYYPSKIAVENLISQADQFINDQNKTEAISVLKQALLRINNIKGNKWPGIDETQSLLGQIDSRLKKLYNWENINQPSIFYEFSVTGFVPQKIILAGDKIYAYSSLSREIYPLNIKNKEISKPLILSTKLWQISSATNIFKKPAFFVKPDQLWIADGDRFLPTTIGISTAEEISLNDNYSLESIASLNGNLYFFDKNYKIIVKYPYRDAGFWSSSEVWAKTKNPSQKYPDTGFLSVNNNVYLLDADNTIFVYRAGAEANSFKPDTYPSLEKIYRIISVSGQPYLYLLEPATRRLIIIDSFGNTIRQYESPAFNDLRDIAMSQDGQTAYLLNASTVYQITIDLDR